MTAVHSIRLEEMRPGRWRAVCSCGQYRSSGYTYKGQAEEAGSSHVRAKAMWAA